MGQDGTKEAKVSLIKTLLDYLKHNGYYIEVSDRLADILSEIPSVSNPEEVKRILGKEIEWVGKAEGHPHDGWYYRSIHGYRKMKLLIGKPNI